jgi:uncharacterized protein (TIGR02266 family)
VRYKRREDFVLEYARDISLGGIFISTEEPVSEGETVDLQLHLPELPQAVKITGKVVRVTQGKGRGMSGMGIAFGELDEFTQSTLQQYLREMTADRECVVDRRGKAVRFDQVLEVHYNTVGEFLIDYSENISKNGMFIKTESPQPIDSMIPALITLPNDERLEVTCRVVHVLSVEEASKFNHAPGMGIEFVHYRGDSQERLWKYIESLSSNE